jgi:hypothetical protein
MKRHIHTAIIFLLFNFLAVSQEIEMNGSIIDAQTNSPIEFVNIGVFHKNKGTVSNQNGKFSMKLPKIS